MTIDGEAGGAQPAVEVGLVGPTGEFINCTLKRSPEGSHTERLARISMEIMQRNGAEVDLVGAVDHDILPGVYPGHRARAAAQ